MLVVTLDPVHSAVAEERPEQIVQTRISNFREIGAAFKHIRDELKSGTPDLQRIRESSQLIKDRGADILRWFPPGTEPPPEATKSWLDTVLDWFSSDDKFTVPGETKSHAKRKIWDERAQFEQAQAKFATEADGMSQAAQSGKTAAISAEFTRLGETCRACHEVYREKID
jgi:hypothetical protein